MAEGRIYDGVWDLVFNSPLVRLARVADPGGAELCIKLEANNPTGSVKDRPAYAMIRAAEQAGQLSEGATIVEATSGNTGISLAMMASVRGYRCVLVMPHDMAAARQTILRAYGAEMVLTPADQGMRGAVDEAERIERETPSAFMPRQFENPENPAVHERTTGPEILHDTAGQLDVFVAGVGTGGTLTGVARTLRREVPGVRVVAVEPQNSAVLSGGPPGLHAIQGLGAGFVPPVLDMSLVDEVIAVSDLDADRMATRLAREEGFLVGPSSGANVVAAARLARELTPDQRVVTVVCDDGERYLK
ncbi:MAG: cysteine synthase A [Myxococcales bacterium]|nr:cysteine synthase A [Myxococcales bacterium]MDD9968040.1 cysteine synthase A [Myxococcales bacterium]